MSARVAYTYVVLRYVHDTTTGEFVNVGVALYAPETRYLAALCRTTYGRLNKVFPGVDGDHFRSLMRYVQSEFEMLGQRVREQLSLDGAKSVAEFARAVLPPDDSSLQWSPMGSGQSANPEATLERLFERMVNRYDERGSRERRSEEDVWRHFKRTLEARHLLRYFEPRTISVEDDEIEFKHTWKNGVVHCLEPISFDLASADGIKEKAHRWLGRMTSIAGSADKFRMYFLVGAPRDEALAGAYRNALRVLSKASVEQKIIAEPEADEFADMLVAEVESHDAEGRRALSH